MRIRTGLAASCLALALAVPAAAQQARPDLDPAMWVVKDPDTTIYLFGTVHALDGKADWFNDEVRTAFDASNELVLEIITPDNPAAVAPLMQKYAIDTSGKTLTSKLSPKHQVLLAEKLKALGLPPNAFDQFRPIFAAMTVTVLDLTAMGISAETGAEKLLMKAARDKKMTIGEVESIEQQFAMLNALDEAEQLRLLGKALEDAGKSKDTINKLIAAWGRGDAPAVAEVMNEGAKESPALNKLLLVDRNKRWAEWIDQRLDKPGTVFMAVGAGHLAGADSVQRYLKERGIDAARVPAAN
jgi:uncharacterized protein YbaP (TraB family)